ncbi:tryptophan--tRNA ligase [Candidatus Falkowbacteria bacterium CG_4_9_14_3_um_filter_38_19]|uniref:Tryptophan--tRNA ligase n=2 Tax=Candidatus Falkowiibacteriota TaxID=1752728 RepID=A0A2M6WRM1_9BACT|nr:MAG: tryptophan--tRNA ligase [Candidatus Falkowbacteria bacterium CG10_big_fil_rev_8_21_14_0_10_38_22]PJB16314.1 MAG: tryptophan--tRNA ligase [Candidatus Falkowbacteria bacterium CG_4_9_14_3_um_filter_38_19]
MDFNKNNNKPTIFSGVQPTGNLHLGNYLGALAQWVAMQDEYNSIFCVVDYHAITVKQEPANLSRQILDTVKIYLAAGINPEKSIIFQQSDISAHTELAWILNTITKNADLSKMTQFKDKSGVDMNKLEDELKIFLENEINFSPEVLEIIEKDLKKGAELITKVALNASLKKYKEFKKKFNSIGVGLFDYPVLMAADILLYNTDAVPVGADQVQHVELSRTLAQRFNSQFGQTFKIPEVMVRKQGARIMGLDNPTKKMSKSMTSAANYIALTDEPKVAAKKIIRAVTDSGAEIKYSPEKKPAIANLLVIYSLLAEISIKELEKNYQGRGYSEFKKDLAAVVDKFLTQFQIKFNSFADNDVREILKQGRERVKPLAEKTLARVKEKLGI